MKKHLRLLALVSGSLVIAACAGQTDSRPAVGTLSQGLNVFSASSGVLSGAYVKGSHALYFDTRRGPDKVDVYRRANPELPPFEMDVRVLDENGRLVYLQMGGDRLVDAEWEHDTALEGTLPRVDPTARAASFALLQEATDAVGKAKLSAEVVHEQNTLVSARLAIHPEMMTPRTGTSAYTPSDNTIELHKEWLIIYVAEHSSTWSNINNTVRVSCNHGACATTMSLAFGACSGSGGVDYHEYSTSNGTVNSPACTTSYDWNSTGGGHNCHDDSVRQIWGVEFGSQGSGTSGVCSNGASHWMAPTSCSISSW